LARRRERQTHQEPRFTRFRFDADLAVMTPDHNAVGDVEPQPRAFADIFGGEKRVEDMALDVGRNAGAVVD
jgi:hypothetical protein